MFKLGVGNDLGISYRWCDFWIKRSKVNVRVRDTVTKTLFQAIEWPA